MLIVVAVEPALAMLDLLVYLPLNKRIFHSHLVFAQGLLRSLPHTRRIRNARVALRETPLADARGERRPKGAFLLHTRILKIVGVHFEFRPLPLPPFGQQFS